MKRIQLTRALTWLPVLALFLGTGLAPGAASAGGDCFVAEIPGEYTLGIEGPSHSDSLRICRKERFTPVSDLYEIFVGGHPAGMLLSRRSVAEGPPESDIPFLVFDRSVDGKLMLYALVVPEGEQLLVHSFRVSKWRMAASLVDGPAEQGDWMLVAANR